MSPSLTDYWWTARSLFDGSRVSIEQEVAASRQEDLAPYLDLRQAQRILDLANGRMRPQYSLLQAGGHQVLGIDLANSPGRTLTDCSYRLARWLYSRHVPNGRKVNVACSLVCGDVGQLPFRDGYFDLVTSMSAFEHFLDVPRVVSELSRVLRPGGLLWVRIHPFTCLSGGHNLSFTEIPLRHLPPGVDAWDHLRQRNIPFTVPLNKWRLDQYLEVFRNHFMILKQYCAVQEGMELLTPEIEAELSEYTREELTCCTYAIVARKAV